MSGGFESRPGGGSVADLDVPGARGGAGAPGKTTRVEQIQAPVQRKIDPSAPGGSDAAGAAPAASGATASAAAPAAAGPGGPGAAPAASRDQRIQSELG